jgi:uncharacterized glyoxalase superfamily protein PhnB
VIHYDTLPYQNSKEKKFMTITPQNIDIVVADMGRALDFYRTLGLDAPIGQEEQVQVQIQTLGGASIGLVTESIVREHNNQWVTPVGQRVTFACRCDSIGELDETYTRVVNAGYTGLKEPWDAFWGQRYAFLQDPDGNRVDLFAAIAVNGQE